MWAHISGAGRFEKRFLAGLVAVDLHELIEVVTAVVEHLDPDPLVKAVHAVAVGIDEVAGDAVGRDADRREEGAVRRARRHFPHLRHARPHLGGERLGGPQNLRIEGWRRGGNIAGFADADLDLGVADRLDQGLAHRLRRGSRKDPAVDVRPRALGQRIGGVARVEQGGDTVGVQDRVHVGILFEQGPGVGVVGIGQQRLERRLPLRGLRRRDAGEVVAGRIGERDGEAVGLDADKRMRQVVDGVVRQRPGAVAAGIGHLERIVLRELLADLDALKYGFAVRVEHAATALVHGKGGVDEIALVRSEVLGAVEGAIGLLATGQGEFQGVTGPVPLLFEPDQGIDPDRRHRLVVRRAAAVEIAVLLDQGEWIARPVFAFRLDDIEVSQHEHGLRLGIAARIDRDQPAFLGMVGTRERMQVGVGDPGLPQTRRHPLGGEGAASRRQRGVGLHQFLVEGLEPRLIGPDRGRRLGGRAQTPPGPPGAAMSDTGTAKFLSIKPPPSQPTETDNVGFPSTSQVRGL